MLGGVCVARARHAVLLDCGALPLDILDRGDLERERFGPRDLALLRLYHPIDLRFEPREADP